MKEDFQALVVVMNGLTELGYGCKAGLKTGKPLSIDCGIFSRCGGERHRGHWNVGSATTKIWFVISNFFVTIPSFNSYILTLRCPPF